MFDRTVDHVRVPSLVRVFRCTLNPNMRSWPSVPFLPAVRMSWRSVSSEGQAVSESLYADWEERLRFEERPSRQEATGGLVFPIGASSSPGPTPASLIKVTRPRVPN